MADDDGSLAIDWAEGGDDWGFAAAAVGQPGREDAATKFSKWATLPERGTNFKGVPVDVLKSYEPFGRMIRSMLEAARARAVHDPTVSEEEAEQVRAPPLPICRARLA